MMWSGWRIATAEQIARVNQVGDSRYRRRGGALGLPESCTWAAGSKRDIVLGEFRTLSGAGDLLLLSLAE